MRHIRIAAGPYTFVGRLEDAHAPATCAAVWDQLPLTAQLIQARWSGESAWIPLRHSSTSWTAPLGLAAENLLTEPRPGHLLLYPGGRSEAEVLFPYGTARFACVHGPLSGNHFATLVEGINQLESLGALVLWRGAQEIRFDQLS